MASQTVLNSTQMMLLRLFSTKQTQKETDELREVLINYYNEKMIAAANKVVKDKQLTEAKVAAQAKKLERTPYK